MSFLSLCVAFCVGKSRGAIVSFIMVLIVREAVPELVMGCCILSLKSFM